MKTPLPELVTITTSSKPAVEVVMVYDDFALGRHAMEIYHRLISESHGQFGFCLRDWAVGLLRNQALNHIAVQEAAHARVIILATGYEELPLAIRKWVEGWRLYKSTPGGMLYAILTCPACMDGFCPVEDYLGRVAADCEREFVVEKVNPPTNWYETPVKAASLRKLKT
jgi:hypothetical protein